MCRLIILTIQQNRLIKTFDDNHSFLQTLVLHILLSQKTSILFIIKTNQYLIEYFQPEQSTIC